MADGNAESDGRFQPGNPGRPRGARNKATVAAESLLDGDAEAITRKAVELAKGGDLTAIRICMDRFFPPRKDRPIPFDLPKLERATDAGRAMAAIVAAVARWRANADRGRRAVKASREFRPRGFGHR